MVKQEIAMENFEIPDDNAELTYAEAIRKAVGNQMQQDKSVLIYGLGVDDPTGMYGTTLGFNKYFGDDRCFDMPLSEDAMTGYGIGLAISGYRPIYVHQRADFLLLCMNQLINMAAKVNYLSSGKLKCPLIVRAVIGRSWGQGAQHSQSLYSLIGNVPWETMTVLYRNCKLFIIATEIEACPNIALESMAAGCVILSSNKPPLPEIFSGSSLNYKARDAEVLSKKIIQVLDENSL